LFFERYGHLEARRGRRTGLGSSPQLGRKYRDGSWSSDGSDACQVDIHDAPPWVVWARDAQRGGLSAALHGEVVALGPVRHLVSPNKIHHLYLQDWLAVFPDAKVWGPQSTINKRVDLQFENALDDEAPAEWAGEIGQVRFHGSPVMDEVVFFHFASRTVIIADLSENFSAAFLQAHWRPWQRVIARLWKIVEGAGRAPLEWRLSWLRRAPARDALRRLLAWDPQQVVMAHGEWQHGQGGDYLRQAFAWLGPTGA
jgi:hypothetical protein